MKTITYILMSIFILVSILPNARGVDVPEEILFRNYKILMNATREEFGLQLDLDGNTMRNISCVGTETECGTWHCKNDTLFLKFNNNFVSDWPMVNRDLWRIKDSISIYQFDYRHEHIRGNFWSRDDSSLTFAFRITHGGDSLKSLFQEDSNSLFGIYVPESLLKERVNSSYVEYRLIDTTNYINNITQHSKNPTGFISVPDSIAHKLYYKNFVGKYIVDKTLHEWIAFFEWEKIPSPCPYGNFHVIMLDSNKLNKYHVPRWAVLEKKGLRYNVLNPIVFGMDSIEGFSNISVGDTISLSLLREPKFNQSRRSIHSTTYPDSLYVLDYEVYGYWIPAPITPGEMCNDTIETSTIKQMVEKSNFLRKAPFILPLSLGEPGEWPPDDTRDLVKHIFLRRMEVWFDNGCP